MNLHPDGGSFSYVVHPSIGIGCGGQLGRSRCGPQRPKPKSKKNTTLGESGCVGGAGFKSAREPVRNFFGVREDVARARRVRPADRLQLSERRTPSWGRKGWRKRDARFWLEEGRAAACGWPTIKSIISYSLPLSPAISEFSSFCFGACGGFGFGPKGGNNNREPETSRPSPTGDGLAYPYPKTKKPNHPKPNVFSKLRARNQNSKSHPKIKIVANSKPKTPFPTPTPRIEYLYLDH